MSSTLRIPESSKEYVHALITWRRGIGVLTVVGYTVEMAFISDGRTDPEPQAADWVSAEWEQIGERAYAKVLIGPGTSLALAEDTYFVWVRVTTGTEVVVRKASGKVIIT